MFTLLRQRAFEPGRVQKMPVERQRGVGAGIAPNMGCVTCIDQGLVRRPQPLLLSGRELLDPRIRGDTRQGGELLRIASQTLDDAERVELFAG